MRNAWRYWSTGGAAAVLAAASQAHVPGETPRALRVSRFPLEETAKRLQDQARKRGVPVFATLRPPEAEAVGPHRDSHALLLVLGTDDSHTPVVQVSRDAPLDLPLTVRLEERDGETAIVFSESDWMNEFADLPHDLIDRVAALPELVDAAVR
jgi:uncharacterized protein (DUF302 family)